MIAAGYTKLFSSIIASTIWREPDHVRLVWITMLAICDRYGNVHASIPGLADLARVSIEHCQDALKRLMAPDEFSRTKDYEGRRIKETDGGWLILNRAKYRDMISKERTRERKRQWDRENRPNRYKQAQQQQNGDKKQQYAVDYTSVSVPSVKDYGDIELIDDPIVAAMAVTGEHDKSAWGAWVKKLNASAKRVGMECARAVMRECVRELFGEMKAGEVNKPGAVLNIKLDKSLG